ARWLRAAGYDAFWKVDIDDRDLVRLAQHEKRFLLTSDTGIVQFGIVRDGVLPALQLPQKMGTQEQLTFVLQRLGLPLREPRCMASGGMLVTVPKEQVTGRVPPRSLARPVLGMRPLSASLLAGNPLGRHRRAVAPGSGMFLTAP